MVTIALVLLVLIALLAVAVLVGGGESVTLDVLGVEVGATGLGLFVTGMVAGVVATGAVVLLRIGMRKAMRQRHRLHELERRARDADTQAHTARESDHSKNDVETKASAVSDSGPHSGSGPEPDRSENSDSL
jgi:hypothetical protein